MLITTLKTILSVLVGLGVLMVLFGVVERVLARGRRREQAVFRKGWGTDVTYLFMTVLVTKPLLKLVFIIPLGVLVVLSIVPAETFRGGLYDGYGPLSRQPWWLQMIQIYLLLDFMAYWSHRFFHGRRWWAFHAVHHSSQELDWLGSVRVHPINELGNRLANAIPVLAMGYNPAVALSAAPIITLYALFLHANVNWDFGPLRGVLASPVFHRWHHSRQPEAWDKNFAGLLPVWDILFGTYYMPRGKYPEDFGICEPIPSSYVGQMVHPFAAIYRRNRKVDPQ